jgi:hypothetical protein
VRPLDTGEYLLVVIDEYSRYPVVEVVRSTAINAIIPVIDKSISQFGISKVIKTDNGRQTVCRLRETYGFYTQKN